MDRRLELVEALLGLSRQCERVAKLLTENVVGPLQDDTLVTTLPTTNLSIDVSTLADWPIASYITDLKQSARLRATEFKFDGLKVLEYNTGPVYPITDYHRNCYELDIITDKGTATGRIIHLNEAHDNHYDIGILYEVLEFCDDPVNILLEMKRRCKRLIIRFRPWTGRDGGFQSPFFNKAYAHLAMTLSTQVRYKVTRPLATYETLLSKTGLSVESRHIQTDPVEDSFDNTVMDVIIARTWGAIPKEEARRIMATSAVEYVVLT
jgi:hypothetical protein